MLLVARPLRAEYQLFSLLSVVVMVIRLGLSISTDTRLWFTVCYYEMFLGSLTFHNSRITVVNPDHFGSTVLGINVRSDVMMFQ